jgi:hypothetical protein
MNPLTRQEGMRAGNGAFGLFSLGGEPGEAVEVDLALGGDDAEQRLLQREHVGDQLGVETHVGVDEQQVAGVGLVVPVRQEEIAALDDVGIADGGENQLVLVARQLPLHADDAADVRRVKHVAVGRRRQQDPRHGGGPSGV